MKGRLYAISVQELDVKIFCFPLCASDHCARGFRLLREFRGLNLIRLLWTCFTIHPCSSLTVNRLSCVCNMMPLFLSLLAVHVLRCMLSIIYSLSRSVRVLQHFHYSYLVNAAAVLAKLRPAWATGNNKDYVETLIRDVNTPSLVSGITLCFSECTPALLYQLLAFCVLCAMFVLRKTLTLVI